MSEQDQSSLLKYPGTRGIPKPLSNDRGSRSTAGPSPLGKAPLK